MILTLISILAFFATTQTTAESSKIDPGLTRIFKMKSTANVFITFEGGNSEALTQFYKREFINRQDRLKSLKSILQEHAAISQAQVLNILRNEFQGNFKSFWISNQIFIQDASFAIVQKIAEIPSVLAIDEEDISEIMMPVIEKLENNGEPSIAAEWGINLIQAPDAWSLDGGNNGENVVISTIDTGVRVSHEALRSNFIGEYGWFDPYAFTASPNDGNGHGTHVTGTIAGQGGIGVAPGAKWMACKGCATSACAQNALLSCGEFILCPTDTKGDNADCSRAPHLVSNSWGGGQGRPVYHSMINAWIAGDIVPVFANGNSGPSCGSANSPADHEGVIAVGSTTNADSLSSFSSQGPSVYGKIKPEVSAPGSSVRSSYHSSDTAYATLSGTSMACPHAAGVIALLKGRDQHLSISTIKKHLTSGIDRDVKKTGKNCGGISEDTWPNNAFGHGRINAFKAMLSLLQNLKKEE